MKAVFIDKSFAYQNLRRKTIFTNVNSQTWSDSADIGLYSVFATVLPPTKMKLETTIYQYTIYKLFFSPDLRQNRLAGLASLRTLILPSEVNTNEKQKCLEVF